MSVYTELRPWGKFIRFDDSNKNKLYPCCVKLLVINAGASLSLQYHIKRAEFWYILEGNVDIHVGYRHYYNVGEGKFFKIPMRVPHRIKAITDSKILETAYGEYNEKDIKRLADEYGRN